MKKINKFLFATCMFFGAITYAAHAEKHLVEDVAANLQVQNKQDAPSQGRLIIPDEQMVETKSVAKRPSILSQLNHDKNIVTYDDQERLKLLESAALRQQGSDTTDSVAFNFEDIDLQNVAEYMERIHNVKFVTDDILDSNKSAQKLAGNKISFRTNAPLSKEESWNLFVTFLSMASLDVVPMAYAGFYRIVPLSNASQEPIPAYIGTSHALLPDNDMFIRYVYFVQNADPAKIQALISKFQGSTGSLQIYKDLKALIFSDKSYNIKSLMTIVKELDKPVSPQAMSVIKLKKANVEDVIKLYASLQPSNQQRAWAPDSKDPASEFFSQNVRVTGDVRTNNLIILGPKAGVDRLEEFIVKYVDVSSDTAKNPVFVYYLEYTNATDMQKTLSQLVVYGSTTSAGQYGGVRDGQKYLQPMTIVADAHSNSLVINATPEDYVAVEKLIKELDVPQKQVALEVLIVQVSGAKTKQLGAQISGPNNTNTFLRTVSAQTSGIPPASGIVTTAFPNEQGIAQSIKSNLANLLIGPINQTGATLLTFGQPIWAIFKVLKTISTTRILQNPFIVVSNNSKGFCKVGTSRRVITGEAISGGNTAATGYQTAEANLSVTIVPQVNDQKIINLAIAIENNQFVNLNSPNDAVQDQKAITTMASVSDGEVLVLGGIMADRTASTTSGVPLFSQIPLFGWLFKNKQQEESKNMFLVFISPKILDNVYSQADVQAYTRNKIEETQEYLRLMDEIDVIDSQQDPLDKIFFGARESKADDISTERLLHRKELVSHHEAPKKTSVKKGEIIKSKYTKKAQKKAQEQSSMVAEKEVEPENIHKYSPKAWKKGGNNKAMNVQTIDMSETEPTAPSSSISSLKNVVQMSSGVAA